MENLKNILNGINIRGVLIFIAIVLFLTSLVSIPFRFKKYWYIFVVLYIISIGFLLTIFPNNIKQILMYVFAPSLLSGILIGLLIVPEEIDETWDVEVFTNKGKKVINNIKRGILIFGSAGSGKTESPIYVLLKHLSNKCFTGIIYDYKDGELSEIAKPLFEERLKIICIHKPQISERVNPFDKKYIENVEIDINQICSVLIMNLQGDGTKTDFFLQNATALFCGIMIKLFLDEPNFCTIPHAVSILLAVDLKQKDEETDQNFSVLKNFLESNVRSKMQASAFILGLDSERQTASVISTLCNSLRNLAFPETFWVLSKSTISLNVNNPEVNTVISVINQPKNDDFLSPFTSTIIHTISKQMMVRKMLPSFLLFDEAPTIKLLNMAKIPATMRSFNVAVIYCAQDIVQGFVKYGKEGFKEIMSNLSTQLFGKANDPDTAKFYEGYFELKEIDQKSVSSKGAGGFLSSTSSSTISKREVSKVRANEFTKLKAGQFAFVSNGKSEMIKFNRLKIEREELNVISSCNQKDLLDNFNKIIEDVNYLLRVKY